MRGLKQRLAKLERKTRATTYYVSAHSSEPLNGFELNGVAYLRQPGETDAELEARVRAVPGAGVRFMREIRGDDIDGRL